MNATNKFDSINNFIEVSKLQPKSYNRPGTGENYIGFFESKKKKRYEKKGRRLGNVVKEKIKFE